MLESVDSGPSKGSAFGREGSNPSSRTGAVRRGGSSPSARTDAAQNLHDWNAAIFEEARRKAEENFDALLSERDDRREEAGMPTLW